jgi:hypothetical protein
VLLAQTTLSLLAALTLVTPTLLAPARVTPVLALGASEIGVHSELACPAPDLVAARLRPLVPDDVALPPGTRIDLRRSDADRPSSLQAAPPDGPLVHVVIVGAGGAADVQIGTVRVDTSCDDAVDEAAVLIAAWLGRYETPASVAFEVEAATTLASPQAERGSEQDREEPDARRHASRFQGTLGLAAGVVQGLAGPATPQGALEGVLLRASGARSRLVARLSLSVSGTRSLPLGPGSSQWQRLAGVLAVGWRERLGPAPSEPAGTIDLGSPDGLGGGPFFVELAAGPIVADARIAGSGYASDFHSSGIDLGLAPALRIGHVGSLLGRVGSVGSNTRPRASVPFEIWLELGCHMWVTVHEVVTASPPMSRRLPWLDAVLSLGTSFGLGQ